MRFGLSLQDDFQGNSSYNAAARFVLSEITQPGGEWVWDLQVGETSLISTEVYLPISDTSSFFFVPHGSAKAANVDVLQDRTRWRSTACAASTMGWISATSSATGARSGPESSARPDMRMCASAIRSVAFRYFRHAQYFVRLSLDQLDNVNFPRKGQQATIEWRAERTDQRPSADPTQRYQIDLVVQLLAAHSFGRYTAVIFGCRRHHHRYSTGVACWPDSSPAPAAVVSP